MLPPRGRGDFQPVFWANLIPIAWLWHAPLTAFFAVAGLLSASDEGTHALFHLLPVVAFALATWYCWNIDPDYYSGKDRQR